VPTAADHNRRMIVNRQTVDFESGVDRLCDRARPDIEKFEDVAISWKAIQDLLNLRKKMKAEGCWKASQWESMTPLQIEKAPSDSHQLAHTHTHMLLSMLPNDSPTV
jgi:hypothetical protein